MGRDEADTSTHRGEAIFTMAFERAPMAMAVVSPEGAWLRVNDALCKLLGYSASELLATTVQKVTHPDDLDAGLEPVGRMLAGEIDRWETEKRYLHRSGAVVWGLLSVSVLRTAEGTPELFISQIVDLTERNAAKTEAARTEVELRRSTAALNAAQRFAGVGSWVWQIPSNRLEWSDEMHRIFGIAKEQFSGDLAEVTARAIHPDDRAAVERANRALIEGGNVGPLEYRVITADGEVRFVSAEADEPRRDERGQPVEVSGVVQDITQRRKLDDTLRFLARHSGASDGAGFFRPLARHLAGSLSADCVCVDRLVGDGGSAESLAMFHDGSFDYNIVYGLKDTPCGELIGQDVCVVPANVCARFPLDAALQKLRAESFIGVTLRSAAGEPIGLIAVISRRPLVDVRLAESILRVVAVRAAGELEREQAAEKLRISNQLLEASQSIAKVGGWELDIVTKELFWTAETYRIHDSSPAEFNPTVAAGVGYFLPESRRIISAALEAAMERGEGYDLVLETLTTKGRRIDVRTTCEVTMHDGRPAKLTGIFQDIGEQVAAEAALRESEQRFRSIVESSPECVKLLGESCELLEMNPAGLEMIAARSMDQVRGLNTLDLVDPKYHELFSAGVAAVFRGETTNQIFEIIALDGRKRWMEQRAVPLWEEQPARRVKQMLAVTRDITDRREAELAREASEAQLKAVIDSALDAIVILDSEQRIVFFNASAERIFGRTASEMLGQPLDLLIPSPLRRRHQRHVSGFASSGTAREMGAARALVGLRADGAEFPIEASVSTVLAGDRRLFIARVRDVTARAAAAAEREALQVQLQQSQKLDSIGKLAGGVAHDFNNMLSVILGTTELALEALPMGGALRADLVEIRKAAERSAALTRQLLAFARQEAIVPRRLDLNETVAGMLTMLRRLLGEDLAMTWTPGVNLWSVKMDPSQVDQLLANLCINARDAVTGVGTVSIRTANATLDQAQLQGEPAPVSGAFVLLSVSDDGCGMDASTLGRIFEPFFTTKEVGKGTGLGLATVYGIVKQNGGGIDVVSELGKGTTFSIYLPRDDSDSARPTQASSGRAQAGRGETVLVVDDEPALLVLCKRFLTRMGYTVLTAHTPREALTLAAEHSAELRLLITDVIMPEMSGRELSEQLTSLYPEVRCLFMSGYTADIIATRGVLEEGVAFVQKPFLTSELAAKVRSVLDAPAPVAAGRLAKP